MMHEWETVIIANRRAEMIRCGVPGGWLYQDRSDKDQPPVYVPDPAAPHCRPKVRRLKLRAGAEQEDLQTWTLHKLVSGTDTRVVAAMNHATLVWACYYGDGSTSLHRTREEAHDALGEHSPWIEVTE